MLMVKNKLVIVETTVASLKEAKDLADLMIAKKLAACVHIDKIKSIYRWKDKIEEATEIKLTFKTTRGKAAALCELLKEKHPYEIPEILLLNVNSSLKQYAKWVIEETKNK